MNKKRIGRLYRLIGRRILKVQRNFQIRDILNLVFIQIILEKSHRSDGGFSSRNFHRKNHIQSTVINDGAGRSHNKIFLTVIGDRNFPGFSPGGVFFQSKREDF